MSKQPAATKASEQNQRLIYIRVRLQELAAEAARLNAERDALRQAAGRKAGA